MTQSKHEIVDTSGQREMPFSGAAAHPNREQLPGKEPHEVHLIRKHTHPSGGISDNGRVRLGGESKHAGWITCPSRSEDASELPRSTQEEFKDVALELEV